MTDKLGIIAGGGHIPGQILQACHRQNRPVFVVILEDFVDDQSLYQADHVVTSMTRVGTIIQSMKKADCRHVCLIGTVKKPSFYGLIPDARGAKLLPKLLAAKGRGDDALLKVIVAELEQEGFIVQGADEVLADLSAPSGLIGSVMPDEDAKSDIRLGFEVARTLGQLDIGQAVIVQQGVVLGVEAIEGTNALIKRCAELTFKDGPGGVLVKACKPQQDKRVDLPTIGPQTLTLASQAGLQGIAVQEGAALMADIDQMHNKAQELGLFVWVSDETVSVS